MRAGLPMLNCQPRQGLLLLYVQAEGLLFSAQISLSANALLLSPSRLKRSVILLLRLSYRQATSARYTAHLRFYRPQEGLIKSCEESNLGLRMI